jgi:hypothetical protein
MNVRQVTPPNEIASSGPVQSKRRFPGEIVPIAVGSGLHAEGAKTDMGNPDQTHPSREA